ncbi:MAG: hypothetical protein NTZ68_02005 [Candidatus Dependentiae bacterium]|nr:hypothetical protein [Candidatus Dependentiae bacterium]
MKKRFVGLMVLLTCLPLGLVGHEFDIELILSPDLRKERDLFMRSHSFADQDSDFLSDEFDKEELAYKDQNGQTLFFHAIFMDEVIGYISFDTLADHKVHVRHLAIDKEMYEPVLIKELLFTVFQVVPQVGFITLVANLQQVDIIALLEELGFEFVDKPQGGIFGTYELFVNNKCKICDVLYGSDFWYGNGYEWDSGLHVPVLEDFSDADDNAGNE